MTLWRAAVNPWVSVISMGLLGALLGWSAPAFAEDQSGSQTAADPTVMLEDLRLMLRPLTKDELVSEADAWLGLVKAKALEISAQEISVRRMARQMEAPEQPSDADAAARLARSRQELLEGIVKLREERTALADRLNTVLTALEAKGGETESYHKYLATVAGLTIDVAASDAAQWWTTVRGWLTSKEGGIRWGWNICQFIATIIVFWILARIASAAAARALTMARSTTDLMRRFVASLVRRIVFWGGVLVAITFLEVQVGPLLAIVGAAGFVVAFALQGTLSNFASGLMILAQRPFDVGDAINVGGVVGVVKAMSLVSTEINTPDNQRVVLPNNAIWGSVITNITGLPTRRVDLTFGIGYGDDADKAMAILEDLVQQHELVLADPAPVVKLHELGDSSVNLVCRPWTKTSDYWTVYWDITRQAKQRFDAAGISIPFPQRDVHLYQETPAR